MREAIVDRLPQTIHPDHRVLVFAGPGCPGQSGIKQLADRLNRKAGREFISLFFEGNINERNIPQSNVGTILTVTGLPHGTLTKVQRRAKTLNLTYPLQALTTGELLNTLKLLAERRAESNGNGNGNGKTSTMIATTAMVDTVIQALEPDAEEAALQTDAPASEPELLAPTIPEPPPTAEQALTTFEKLRQVAEEAAIAAIAVTDEITSLTAARDALREKVDELEAQAAKQRDRIDALTTENDQMMAELSKLTKLKEGLSSLMQSGS